VRCAAKNEIKMYIYIYIDTLLREYTVYEFKEIVLVHKSDSVYKSLFWDCSLWLHECRIYIYMYKRLYWTSIWIVHVWLLLKLCDVLSSKVRSEVIEQTRVNRLKEQWNIFSNVCNSTQAKSVVRIINSGLVILFFLVLLASCYHLTYALFQMLRIIVLR